MPKFGNILVVDDDEDVLLAARLLLKPRSEDVHIERDPDNISARLAAHSYEVILLDMNFSQDATSGREGFTWLSRILEQDPSAVVVLITAFGGIETAVEAIRLGATDFVLKPWQNEKLLATLSAAARLRASRREVSELRSRQRDLTHALDRSGNGLIGSAPSMREVFDTIEKVAVTDANVLILGENGSGKDAVASVLHRHSLRSEEVFIPVDVGAISETLFESELFGHVKGAFTDAKEHRAGRFEVASGGSLFLDEIGSLPVSLQAKLLHAIERREVIRVGSNKPIPVDVRLICATNIPIYEKVQDGTFRQDLLYRINTVEIRIPPLRERTEDIPTLAQHFLETYSRKYDRPGKTISEEATRGLLDYAWPGNVRELQHAVERAVIMSESQIITPHDFLLTQPPTPSAQDSVFESYNLEAVERTVIQKAIQKHTGNISQAARELGLTRSALYRRLEKHGL